MYRSFNIYYVLPLSIAAPDLGDFVCWFPVTEVTWNIQGMTVIHKPCLTA